MFKTTFRNLWKNKGYSFLNIFGLAIGIACAGLIFLWVEDELNFDQFNTKKDQLYFIRENQKYDAYTATFGSTPVPLAPAMQSAIPGIANTCRIGGWGSSKLISIGDKNMYSGGSYVDASLFSMFTFPFVEGNAKTAFSQLHSMVITQATARKFFGTDKNVLGKTVRVDNKQDYISLTDIARYRDTEHTDDIIKNWMRNRNTIELLGFWEMMYNPNFKPVEFDGFKKQAGLNSFVMTPKRWIENTNAIGIVSKAGRYGGTFAHKDIALEFASWISIEFKLFIIKEFQRLKEEESSRNHLEWDIQRTLAKVNYRIHTDAIKENLIPKELTKYQISMVYANEADLLNVALFGLTAKEWRDKNPGTKGNIRDEATIEQLVVLSNMESINALLIQQGSSQSERLVQLNKVAITQMRSLLENSSVKKLK